jgi:Gluconate 2-dehydrogenase subunit 3
MPRLSRRAFLARLAAVVPAAAIARHAHALAVDHVAADQRTLRALGDVVLPSELGTAGTRAAVEAFQRWIAGYREGAELLHGYGTSRLERAGPTPATRWASQLDRLDADARARHGRAFADLPLDVRRRVVHDTLDAMKADAIPSIGRAPHVALALLAHWAASPDATDRCYRAHIGRQTCRPLAAQARRPLPLAADRA